MSDIMTAHYVIAAGGRLVGDVRVPGDKSISHRAIMLGALAEGVTEVGGFLEGEDAIATMNVFRALGVHIDGPDQGRVRIDGVGLHGLRKPRGVLDCGNSGTSMRLLCGLLAAQSFESELTGDASLTRRPMRRVALPLREMGADIRTAGNGFPPLTIHPVNELHGISYQLPVASAQVKSALLLAGLYAHGLTCVIEPAPTRDHTERMLWAFAYPVQREGRSTCVRGGAGLTGTRIEVPADISSAAFFMVGASIAPGSDIMLFDVGINPTRAGVIEILRMMGADISLLNERKFGGEPVADIRVRHADLCGIAIPRRLVPLAIDEFPALFIAAASASGETWLRGAGELRVKESDRIQVMADGLQALGVAAEPTADGMRIVGASQGNRYRGGEVESHGDHRIAMAFSIAALAASETITVRDCANVATSFPGFVETAQHAGLRIESYLHG
ncbi:MAG: 3-phosphoshikimate 1-carboxyvinyltransferase [Pseudomonadota bacterium]|nr:3-phosphoshikimate 1-carboxyvinyltransferase [Burkholderiales bacterium]MDQ3194950.1 3-phosphoshikimate 1-carboxyvinyltransferase [Pseudomonadota bacterium]